MFTRDPFLTAAAVFTALMAMALIGTEVLRAVVQARRERAGMGMAGTQDIALWGVIVSAVFAVGAVISLIALAVRALVR